MHDSHFYDKPIVTLYRGTQSPKIKGARKSLSFTPSLPVAIIWSALPGDIWSGRKTQFLDKSTVHTIEATVRNPLIISKHGDVSLGDILENLRYGYVGGIDEEEVRKIYNYMHNRLTGKAPGGEFKYNVCDDTGELVDEDEVPFSLISPETKISWIAREEWDADPSISTGYRVAADTFIFADAPAVQRAAIAQGYDAIVYPDVFQGGEDASEKLFGCDVTDLDGVWEAEDLDDDDVPMHWTLRLIDPSIVVSQDATPTAEILRTFDPCTGEYEDES